MSPTKEVTSLKMDGKYTVGKTILGTLELGNWDPNFNKIGTLCNPKRDPNQTFVKFNA